MSSPPLQAHTENPAATRGRYCLRTSPRLMHPSADQVTPRPFLAAWSGFRTSGFRGRRPLPHPAGGRSPPFRFQGATEGEKETGRKRRQGLQERSGAPRTVQKPWRRVKRAQRRFLAVFGRSGGTSGKLRAVGSPLTADLGLPRGAGRVETHRSKLIPRLRSRGLSASRFLSASHRSARSRACSQRSDLSAEMASFSAR